MKAVMLSIQPKWCELIASGKKTVEVRKTAPKLQTPFKCYIYCTASDIHSCLVTGGGTVKLFHCCNYKTAFVGGGVVGNGSVIGEFVCDRIKPLPESIIKTDCYDLSVDAKRIVAESCLTREEVLRYMGDKVLLYGLHISDLKIYDKPKELGEFVKPCNHIGDCCTCKRAIFEDDYFTECGNLLSRPPQSWCYVEEIVE